MPATNQPARDLLRDLTRPWWAALAAVSVLLTLESGVTLALPLLGGKLAERFVAAGTADLAPTGALLLALLLVQLLLRLVTRLRMLRIGDEMVVDLRKRTLAHLLRLPIAEHHARPRGDQLSLLTTDAYAISGFVSGTVPSALPTALTFLGALAAVAWLRPGVALAIVLALVPAVVILKLWTRTIGRRGREWYDAQASSLDIAEQAIDLIPVVKAEAREDQQLTAFARTSQAALEKARALRRVSVPLNPITQLATVVGVVVLILLLARPDLDDPSAAARTVTLLLYGLLVARPTAALAGLAGSAARTRGAVHRIVETLALTPESGTGTLPLPERLSKGIRFENVTFAYEPDRPVLENFDLEIKAGQKLAITGMNGAGKSTLINLLLRYYEPQAGKITIDGRDIRDYDLTALRRAIALVPQKTWLLHGTIEDNIRLGSPQATRQEVEQAAELADASGFIEQLPKGYDTMIGPRGATLSGGQQQRIALARALITQTPIVALDEPTAMFDDVGEQALMERLEGVLKGRTVVLVTHRSALIGLCDGELGLGRIEDGR